MTQWKIILFLRARLDEDERRWTRLRDAVWPELVVVVPSIKPGPRDPDEPAGCVTVGPQYAPKAFARVWNPVHADAMGLPTNFDCGWRYHESAIELLSPEITARALAEVASKRQVIDDIVDEIESMEDWIEHEVSRASLGASGRLLALLALPYADHPDYDPAWGLELPR